MIPRRVIRNGREWLVNNQEEAFWNRVEGGEWEPLTFAVFDRFLDPEHSYIDVGAWIGPTVLYGAHLARHCYALEPDPVAFSRLKENVLLNAPLQRRITLSPQCLSTTCDPVRLGNKTSHAGGDSMSSLLFAGAAVTWEAAGVTLERFLVDHRIGDCSFIKMDIEGGEFEVLPAIADYLTERRPTLYLSLHPGFVPDPEPGMTAISGVLATYRHVYTPDLREVGLDAVQDPATFRSCYELVISDVDCS